MLRDRLGACGAGLAWGAAGTGHGLGLGSFGGGSHGGIPVKNAAATVAGEHLALAELVPHLGANAHAAADALLIVDAGHAGASGIGDAVEAGEPLGLDERPENFALGVECVELSCELMLTVIDAGAGLFQSAGHDFHLDTGLCQCGLQGLGAFQAGELLVFEPVGFGGFKVNLVLDGCGLLRGLHGVELGAEAGGLLAVAGDLAFEAGAERFLAAEGGGGLLSLTLSGSEGSLRLGELGGQGACLLDDAGPVQFDSLQLYEVFNQLLHPCQEGYGIGALFRKCGWDGGRWDCRIPPMCEEKCARVGREFFVGKGRVSVESIQ